MRASLLSRGIWRQLLFRFDSYVLPCWILCNIVSASPGRCWAIYSDKPVAPSCQPTLVIGFGDPPPKMSPPPIVRETMAVRTRSRQSRSTMPIASNDATNDADARPRPPPGTPSDHDFAGNDDNAMEMRGEANEVSDWAVANDAAMNDASATDVRRDAIRSEERDDERRGGGNDDYGTENLGASDGGGRSVRLNFATGDDADNPTDDSGVDPGATANKYFTANSENDGVEGSVDGSWKPRMQPARIKNHKQDDFVKNGARFRAILTSALRAVVDGMSSNAAADSCGDVAGDRKVGTESERGTVNDGDGPARTQRQQKADYARVLSLAREKAEESMAMKRVSIRPVDFSFP